MGRKALSVKGKVYKRLGKSFAVIDIALEGKKTPNASLQAARLIIEIILKYEKDGGSPHIKDYEDFLKEVSKKKEAEGRTEG